MGELAKSETSPDLCKHRNFIQDCKSCATEREEKIIKFFQEHTHANFEFDQTKTIQKIVMMLEQQFQAQLDKYEETVDQEKLLPYLLATLNEGKVNFNGIFDKHLSWKDYHAGLQKHPPTLQRVEPLEYFTNVGNGMDTAAMRDVLDKVAQKLQESDPTLAQNFLSDDVDRRIAAVRSIVQSDVFYEFIDKETIEQKRIEEDYDHVTATMAQLNYLASGHELPPALVMKYGSVPDKFAGKDRFLADGSHRALVSAMVRKPQYVFEIDMNKIATDSSSN